MSAVDIDPSSAGLRPRDAFWMGPALSCEQVPLRRSRTALVGPVRRTLTGFAAWRDRCYCVITNAITWCMAMGTINLRIDDDLKTRSYAVLENWA